jgi:hypothetical protein
MRLKTNRQRLPPEFAGTIDHNREHLDMGAMHPVKIPNARYGRPEVGRNVLEFVKRMHLDQKTTAIPKYSLPPSKETGAGRELLASL